MELNWKFSNGKWVKDIPRLSALEREQKQLECEHHSVEIVHNQINNFLAIYKYNSLLICENITNLVNDISNSDEDYTVEVQLDKHDSKVLLFTIQHRLYPKINTIIRKVIHEEKNSV